MNRKTTDISRTLVGNKIVDHSDVVGESPVGIDKYFDKYFVLPNMMQRYKKIHILLLNVWFVASDRKFFSYRNEITTTMF